MCYTYPFQAWNGHRPFYCSLLPNSTVHSILGQSVCVLVPSVDPLYVFLPSLEWTLTCATRTHSKPGMDTALFTAPFSLILLFIPNSAVHAILGQSVCVLVHVFVESLELRPYFAICYAAGWRTQQSNYRGLLRSRRARRSAHAQPAVMAIYLLFAMNRTCISDQLRVAEFL